MSDFAEVCLRPVQRFLQTVMVIDDHAYYGHRSDVGDLEDPFADPTSEVMSEDSNAEDDSPTEPPLESLDAKALVDEFARFGLVCGVMRPDPPMDDQVAIAMPAASRADLIVLDWHLQDRGDHALSILGQLAGKPGLRLVAVYTYDDDLEEVATRIEARLAGEKTSPHRVTSGDLVVEVYAKEGAPLAGLGAERVRSEQQLPQQLIKDFGNMTRGVVPSAAVAVIGAIRAATPRVLGLLGQELDPGYLGHRVLLPDPDEAADQLLDLIGAELRTVIEDDPTVNEALGWEPVKGLVEDMPAGELSSETLLTILQEGAVDSVVLEPIKRLREYMDMSTPKLGDAKGSQTRHFTAGDTEDANRADRLFARRMSLRTDSGRPPQLKLGTVVREREKWMVCAQPLCDGVRIDAPRCFPFIPAKEVDMTSKQDLLVQLEGIDHALRFDLSVYSLEMIEFRPDEVKRAVIGTAACGAGFVFTDTSGRKFRYVAQLRRDHAQRLATNFAHGVGRVGLDESELQRRWRDKRSG